MSRLPLRERSPGRPWHLIEKPRSPFRCDVCGATIPDHEAASFTTLAKMYYETPPTGYEPCNRAHEAAGYDAWSAEYQNVVSRDREPTHGGRFVFTRRGETLPAVYGVEVFLPNEPPLTAVLRWDDASRPVLEPELADPWAHDEALKLARVLQREKDTDPRSRLSRWRGRSS